MTEKHIIKFSQTFIIYQQFQLKPDSTSFEAIKSVDNLFYGYNGQAYKVHRVGTRGSYIVFYSKQNMLFKEHNPSLKIGDNLELIITDEPIESFGLKLAE